MKNRKWLNYTLGFLLTLIVLAVVAGAGFRVGMTQNASFARLPFTHNFVGAPQAMRGNFQNDDARQPAQGNFQNDNGAQGMQGNFHDNNGGPQAMQGNFDKQRFDNRSGDRRDGMPFFSPIFGLIHLVVLGLLVWIGYKLVKKSGWRLSLARTSPAPVPAPSATETPSVVVEEKKESE